MKLTKELIIEMIQEALYEDEDDRSSYSPIKPWKSALVVFDKKAGAPPIAKGMVRVKAKIAGPGTHKLKKNYHR